MSAERRTVVIGDATLILGDALEVMAGLPHASVAAALAETLRINQSRRWPSPGSVPEGEAVEHEEGGK